MYQGDFLEIVVPFQSAKIYRVFHYGDTIGKISKNGIILLVFRFFVGHTQVHSVNHGCSEG